ncbi:MAG TPA: sugar ABC transporter permease, partial [Spirochaetia bacterium]|nr:sugar ABC transporter permease [Spirochaetia bacterium]
VVYVLYLSLQNYSSETPFWIGLANYGELLFRDEKFWTYFLHSMEYVLIAIGTGFIAGLLVALSLNAINRFQGTFRAVALIAWAVPPVIASLMWKWILNDTNGAINDILFRLHVIGNPVPWLSLPVGTMVVLGLVHAWTVTPFIMVILLAGLQSIPVELSESAEIDGAGSLMRFRRITYPLLKPAVLSAVMISSIFAFRTIDIVFTLTKGGPGDATEMLVTYVYDSAFRFMKLGYAAAISVIMVIISMLMVLFFVKVIRTESLD